MEGLTSAAVKARLIELGAELCGVAAIDRFDEAPEGFHPRDVLPDCQSVIVFACRFLAGTFRCRTSIPYTIVRNMLSDRMDKMAVQLCTELERQGVCAVPTGTIGPTEFDEATGRYRNIVSAKHCAQAAGLGVIGHNTLLMTPELGNMVWLSVILTEAELEPDEPRMPDWCAGCDECVRACPVHALDGELLDQAACAGHAFGSPGKGEWRIVCYRCREVCTHRFGTNNRPAGDTVGGR